MTDQKVQATPCSGSAEPVIVALPRRTGWWRQQDGKAVLHGTGDISVSLAARLAALVENPLSTLNDIGRALKETGGFFALVIVTPYRTLLCVDRIRSTPLIWTVEKQGNAVVAQSADDLFAAAGKKPEKLDNDQALAVAMAGFTVGAHTLFSDCRTLLPGQFAVIDTRDGRSTTVEVGHYHRYAPWRNVPVADEGDAAAAERLSELTLEVLQDSIRKADGRPILAPLSAGLDSRLVVSGLKHLGHEDVICFAYGLAGNREASASRAIANRLGYRWAFTPYDNASMAKIFAGDRYQDFMRYADSLTSIHFPQDFPAITDLQEKGYLPEDGLVVNGQSGDFIAGNHIPKALVRESGIGTDQVIDALLAKHFTQWGFLTTRENTDRIGGLLRDALNHLTSDEGVSLDDCHPFGLYEASEFVDRQSKYVVNGQRTYDYLNLAWDLPLWHDRYLEFWETQPLARKAGQKLYRDMLFEQNWGGVWRDIAVNPSVINPPWMRPLRFLLKCVHAPLGRAQWHRFETRYLAYHMSALCGYAVRRWHEVASDTRSPRTALSFHIEDYLVKHGVDLGSLSRADAA